MKRSIASALSLFCLFGCGINNAPGTGEKIGQIVKLKKVGILRDTWEAELIRGGMSGGSGSFGMTPFDFTIESESEIPAIKEYMEKQTEVLIHYRTEGVYGACRSGSGGSFLVSIEPAKK